MKQYGILAINPGSTSTKIAVYLDETEAMSRTIRHSAEELRPFARVTDQFGFRRDLILKVLEEEGIALDSLSAVIGRGGLVKPIASGVYEVNDALRRDLIHAPPGRSTPRTWADLLAVEICVAGFRMRRLISPIRVVVDELGRRSPRLRARAVSPGLYFPRFESKSRIADLCRAGREKVR